MHYRQRHFSPERYIPRVYGYGRVSHKKQFDLGNSLEDQEKRILMYYELRKLDQEHPFSRSEWAGMHFEPRAQSAFSRPFRKRPAGSKLSEIMQPGDQLIIDKFDRMFRSNEDCVLQIRYFVEWGIRVHFVNLWGMCVDMESRGGRYVLGQFGLLAEMESGQISDRVCAARAARRKAGVHSGVTVPAFCDYIAGDDGKTRGGKGKIALKSWAISMMDKIVHLRDVENVGFNVIGHETLRDDLDKATGHIRGMRRERHVERMYWFKRAWDNASQPDINTLKFADFIDQYKRSLK